jgi:hypothetical protein
MKRFDPQKALTEYGYTYRSRAKSCFDHPRIEEWVKVWLPDYYAGKLSWKDILELIHRGCEVDGSPFPPRGHIGERALSRWAYKFGFGAQPARSV